MTIGVVLGKVRVGSLDLHKAFTAYRLVTAPGVVEVRGICQKTDGAFGSILVQIHLERLAVDEWIVG